MPLFAHFRAMARNNLWSNDRLLGACAELTSEELHAPRVSFFPSLMLTLNHILRVDAYYLGGKMLKIRSGSDSKRFRQHPANVYCP